MNWFGSKRWPQPPALSTNNRQLNPPAEGIHAVSPSLGFRLVVFLTGLFTVIALRSPSKPKTSEELNTNTKPLVNETAMRPTSR